MCKLLYCKKILFIGIGFYDYEQAIVEEMISQGAVVDYFKIGYQNFEIRIAKYIPFIKEFMIKKLNRDILKKADKEYDYVFVIKGEFCMPFLFERLRKNLNAIFIMYQWDCISRVRNYELIKSYFDYIYSFDREDVNDRAELIFRPLFYKNEFNMRLEDSDFNIYDVCSIGVYYDYRYQFYKKIYNKLNKKKLFLKVRIGIPFYLKKLIIERERLEKKLIMFRSTSAKENLDLIKNSSVILDVCNPIQSGLTMRTMEALGMKKKLITTNKDIINYDFYCADNIFIIDLAELSISNEFFEKPYKVLSDDIYNNYTISKWISDIFNFIED